MAELRQFGNVETMMEPTAPVRRSATDQSAAIRESAGTTRERGAAEAIGSAIESGVQGYQAIRQNITNKRVEELLGVGTSLPAPLDATQLTDEEASDLNFQQIAEARGRGLSSSRARVAATTRLQQAIARDPGRADAYKSAFNNFFGGTSGSVFQKSEMEEAQEAVINDGLTRFGLDPRLAYADPSAWEQKYQMYSTIRSQVKAAEEQVKLMEAGKSLAQDQQRQVLPQLVAGYITNPESENYLPSLVQQVIGASGAGVEEEFNPGSAVEAESELRTLQTFMTAQIRNEFPDVDTTTFNNMVAPINDYIDNAVRVANGEMTVSALERRRKVYEEGIAEGIRTSNPEAATKYFTMVELTRDLPQMTFEAEQTLNSLAKQIMSSFEVGTDPEETASPGDTLSGKKEEAWEDYSQFLSMLGSGVSQKATDNPDQPTVNDINDGLVLFSKEVINNPDRINVGAYDGFFKMASNPSVVDKLSPEAMSILTESLSSNTMQEFMNQSLERFRDLSAENESVRVNYNADTNRLTAVYDTLGLGRREQNRARRLAQRINGELSTTNLMLNAVNNVLGEGGEAYLGSSEVGKGMLAFAGAEITEEGQQDLPTTLRDATVGEGTTRLRISGLADRIASGNERQGDLEEFGIYLDRYNLDRVEDENIKAAISSIANGGQQQGNNSETEDREEIELRVDRDINLAEIARSVVRGRSELSPAEERAMRELGDYKRDNNLPDGEIIDIKPSQVLSLDTMKALIEER